jgi:hypothetical protein
MKRLISVLSLGIALAVPFAATAQTMPNAPGPATTMSPDQMAQSAKVRSDARVASMKALSPAHQTAVQAIVDQLNAGKVEPRAAVTQIDGILSPEETSALGAIGTKMRTDMRAVMQPLNANPSSPAPSEQRGEGVGGRGRPLDAGQILLQVMLTPAQMQAINAALRPSPRAT